MTTASSSYRAGIAPGPRGHLVLGKLIDVWRNRLGMMTDIADEYGDAVRFKIGPKSLFFFNHPDHAKYVLVDNIQNFRKGMGLVHAKRALGDGVLTSEGELWRKQRRAVQPVFQRDRIAGLAPTVAEATEAVMNRWRREPAAVVDVVDEMTDLTLRVLGESLLDVDLTPYVSMGPAFEVVQEQAMFEMVTLGRVPHRLPLPRHRRFARAKRDLDGIVGRLVEGRRAELRPERDDLLSRLIQSWDQEPDRRVADARIRDEVLTMLLAGHETTSSTLAWTWYELDRHPDVAERLRAEADQVLDGRPPGFEDLHRMPFAASVVNEVLRLHPVVWILPRRAVADDEIGGYHVPAGSDVLICPYTLHRHPDFWDEPDRFLPDRFGAGQSERPRYSYIPFGAGPRVCVGSNLGLLEATLATIMIARSFRLRLKAGREVVADPMLSLRIRGGLPMHVEPIVSKRARP